MMPEPYQETVLRSWDSSPTKSRRKMQSACFWRLTVNGLLYVIGANACQNDCSCGLKGKFKPSTTKRRVAEQKPLDNVIVITNERWFSTVSNG